MQSKKLEHVSWSVEIQSLKTSEIVSPQTYMSIAIEIIRRKVYTPAKYGKEQ